MKRQGIIKKVFFQGDKDFCILLCRCENNEIIIKGALPSPESHRSVIFDGELKEDNQHRSYIKTKYLKFEEDHTKCVKGVFSELNIWGLGSKSVMNIMDVIGIDPITSIALNPEIINQCQFLALPVKEAIRVRLAPCDEAGIFHVLNHWGFSEKEQRFIFEAWNENTLSKILSNPFELTCLDRTWLAKAVNLKQRLNPDVLAENWADEIIVSLVKSKHRMGFSGGGVRSLIQQASKGIKSLGDVDWKAALDLAIQKGTLVIAPNGLVQSTLYAENEQWLCSVAYKKGIEENSLCVWEYDSCDHFFQAMTSYVLNDKSRDGKYLFVSELGGKLSKASSFSITESKIQEVKLDDLGFVDFSLINGVFLHDSIRWSLDSLHGCFSLIPRSLNVILSHFFYGYSEGYDHPLLDLLVIDVLPVVTVDHILKEFRASPPTLNHFLVRNLDLFQVPPSTKNEGIKYINLPSTDNWINNLKVELNLFIKHCNQNGQLVSVVAPMSFGELSLKVMTNEIKNLFGHKNLVVPDLMSSTGGCSQRHVVVPVTKKLIDVYGVNWWYSLFWQMCDGPITIIGDIDAFNRMVAGPRGTVKKTTIGQRWVKEASCSLSN